MKNGKTKTFRRLLSKDKIHRFEVKPGDYFYTKIPRDSNRDFAEMVLHELRCIFPKNQVFVIPDTIEIQQLTDEELKPLGLQRIPKLEDKDQAVIVFEPEEKNYFFPEPESIERIREVKDLANKFSNSIPISDDHHLVDLPFSPIDENQLNDENYKNNWIDDIANEELKPLGLQRIPKVQDVKTCPKCKSGSTMKEFSGDKYRKVCLDKSCGFAGGWRDKSELEKIK